MRCSLFIPVALAALPLASTSPTPLLDPRNGIAVTACALVSSSASSLLALSPKATPTVDAQLAYQCLNSARLYTHHAQELVEAMLPFVEWQSTIEYLVDPPKGYTEPAVDLRKGFKELLGRVKGSEFRTEYEFQAALYKLVNSVHDGHFRFVPDLLSKAIAFRRPFPLVSVSLDGKASPKVYSYRDILLSQNSSFVPSAVEMIDGVTATQFVEELSQLGALNDPDALYNAMFYSPAFAAEQSGWLGYYAGSGRFGWIYPGANNTYTFGNGTETVVENVAAVIGNFTGVTDGDSLYQKFCAVTSTMSTAPTATPTSNSTTSSSMSSATATSTSGGVVIATGYPLPVVISKDQQVSGYYLPNSDVAVLSMISFAPTIPIRFQQAVQKFLAAAKADGKTKLVIDLAANGGGLILQGYDTFRQLFPQIVQEGNTRFRDAPEFMALASAISGALPPGFDPYTSGDDDLINLWGTFANWGFDYSIENKPFASYKEKFSPHEYYGDNFTNIIRWNLNDPLLTINETYGMGEYITGYDNRTNFTQPFAAEDIIMIYDGYCASTCTLFSEFMRTQAGVRSIAFGGRSSPNATIPIIQGIGGTKGANNFAYAYVSYLATNALEQNITKEQESLIKPLTNSLPDQRSTDTSLNARDNILPNNLADGTPAQFIYEPADCRLFYTPAMMANVTAIWEAAAAAAWGGATCNAGSFPGSNGTYRRDVKQHAKREMEVVDLGGSIMERTEGWYAKYVMNFPK